MKKNIKKSVAKESIRRYAELTSFFGSNNKTILGDDINTRSFLWDMFHYRFGMGEAETECIIASLVIAGATIIDD